MPLSPLVKGFVRTCEGLQTPSSPKGSIYTNPPMTCPPWSNQPCHPPKQHHRAISSYCAINSQPHHDKNEPLWRARAAPGGCRCVIRYSKRKGELIEINDFHPFWPNCQLRLTCERKPHIKTLSNASESHLVCGKQWEGCHKSAAAPNRP